MNDCKQRVINGISKIIPITQKCPINNKINSGYFSEYSLKQNCFDPSKNSPPNDFMLKLKLRMSLYVSLNKETNLLKE